MTSSEKLAAIYNMELNILITTFWDAGYYASLGDSVNGYNTHCNFDTFDQAVDFLYSEAEKYVAKLKGEA